MHWYENNDGSTKTHRRPTTCEHCREHPKGGCALPFRKTRKVRWLSALDKKPMFFGSLWFNKFKRSNAALTERGAKEVENTTGVSPRPVEGRS